MTSPRRVALLTGLLAFALAVVAPAHAATPGKNGKLVYQTSGGDVVVGSALPEVDDEVLVRAEAEDPRWSSDGTWIVLTIRGVGDTESQVARIRPDGTGFDRLTTTDTLDSGRAAFSPDGIRIVFDRYNLAGDRERIMIMNADGTGLRPLTSPGQGEYDYSPVFSPDGRTIAFVSEVPGAMDIHLMSSDGTNRRPFVSSASHEDRPAWSPDGTRIAYEHANDIVVKPITGGPFITIAESSTRPEWSPDGRWIIYTATRTKVAGLSSEAIHRRRSDGTGEEVRIRDMGTLYATWQPLCNLKGNDSGNTLVGTPKSELLCGKGGRDTIRGRGGVDIILGGPGGDLLLGGVGNDVLVGQQGNDRFDGGNGKDRCVQGPGSGSRVACES